MSPTPISHLLTALPLHHSPHGFLSSCTIPNFKLHFRFPLEPTQLRAIYSAPSEFLHTPPTAVPFFPAGPPAAPAPGALEPPPPFPRPRATVGALDPREVTFFLRHRPRGGRGAPPAPARLRVFPAPCCGTPRPPQARSRPPRPHFLTRPPPVSRPTASPRAALEPECRERRAAGAFGGRAWSCAGRKAALREVAPPTAGAPGPAPPPPTRGECGRPAASTFLARPHSKGGRPSGLSGAFVGGLR